jgi:hypothetical protein
MKIVETIEVLEYKDRKYVKDKGTWYTWPDKKDVDNIWYEMEYDFRNSDVIYKDVPKSEELEKEYVIMIGGNENG